MNLLLSIGAALLSALAPSGAHVRRDLVYADGDRGRLDVYSPRLVTAQTPIAVFIYGGSWQSGDKGLYRFVGQVLASRGVVTVIPDYRVYPAVRYPDFLRDNALAVRFARSHAADWGADPGRLFLIGHSAGAYNVAMLAFDRRWLGEVGLDPRHDVAGVIGLSGPYDFLPLRDDTLKIIFGPSAGLGQTQPINYVDGQGPPTLLLAGSADSVVDPGNATRMAAAITARGGVARAEFFAGVGHVGALTAILGPWRHRAPVLDEMMAFVARAGAPTSQKVAA